LRKGKYEKKGPFVPVRNTNRDKGAPPFVPDWSSRLGNRDNSGFPTGTNQRFCSSEAGLTDSSNVLDNASNAPTGWTFLMDVLCFLGLDISTAVNNLLQ